MAVTQAALAEQAGLECGEAGSSSGGTGERVGSAGTQPARLACRHPQDWGRRGGGGRGGFDHQAASL
jgi:hypothetical protein